MIDLFTTPFTLYYNQKPAFSTAFSKAISIIILLVFIAFIVYYSRILFDKTNLSVNTVTSFPENLNITTNFDPDKFFIELSDVMSVEDINSFFDIEAYNWDSNFQTINKLNLVTCSKEYPNNYNQNDIINICFEKNKNVTLYKDLGLTIIFYRCHNTTEKESKCKTDEEIDFFLENNGIYLAMSSMEANPYVHKDPYIQKYIRQYINLSINKQRYIEYFFGVIKTDTDDHLLLENSKIDSSFILNDYMEYSFNSLPDQPILSLDFHLEGNQITIKRKYKKIQDILSALGGIFPVIEILGNFIVKAINPILLRISFINDLFNFNEKKVDGRKLSQNKRINKNEIEGDFLKINTNLEKKVDEKKMKELEFQPTALNFNQLGANHNLNKIDNNHKQIYDEFFKLHRSQMKKKQIRLSPCEIFFTFLCPLKFTPSKYKRKKECIMNFQGYLADKMDIISLVNYSRELSRIKKVILKDNERLLFENASKPNIEVWDKDQETIRKDSFNKLYKYYAEIKNLVKTRKEEILLKMLDKDTVIFFEEKLIKEEEALIKL
jgi:hypothetical protein